MTTTPTIWKPKFFPNFAATVGQQYLPQSIGLANGNILVVWGDKAFGPGAGTDIVGRIFDPLGNPTAAPQFQVNTTDAADEFEARLAALPDGGFVMAYGFHSDLVVERFDSAGVSVAKNSITTETYLEYSVTIDGSGDYIVAFGRSLGDDGRDDVHAIVYNGVTNAPGPEHVHTAQNGEDFDNLGDIDTFANGDIIAISDESDDSDLGFDFYKTTEIRITSATGSPVGSPVHIAGSDDHGAIADDVAVLTGGKFVALYHYREGSSSIAFRIGTVAPTGVTLGAEKIVAPASGGATQIPSVVALQDGGFFVAWISGGTVFGTRYSASGTVIGQAGLTVATFASGDREALGELSLTSDGRILVPFRDGGGEIAEVILDPRDSFIVGTEGNDVLTAQTTASVLFGEGGHDRLYGSQQDDIIVGGADDDIVTGGLGDDNVQGGADNDQLYGDGDNDSLFGEAGDDFLDGGLAATRSTAVSAQTRSPAASATTPTCSRPLTGPTRLRCPSMTA